MTAFAASLLVKVTAIVLLALGVTILLRRRRAAVRHVLLAATFAALFVVPLASLVVPVVSIAVPIATAAHAPTVPAIRAVTADESTSSTPTGGESMAAAAQRRAAWPSRAALIAGCWLLGTTLFLLPVIAGLSQVRALRRAGLPWPEGQSVTEALARETGVGRTVGLLVHESVPGPMTCGIVRPVIVLPVDARQWPAADLRRAIVHELEHVRRADWITHCLARVACGVYWFHPLVWIARRRLSLEAERACDDAVVGGMEPTAYADQLIVLAERLSSAAHPPVLAMASRHDLAARVTAVLDSTQQRGRAGTRWLATACAAAALLVMAMAPIRLVAVARTPAQAEASRQRFAAASIKPCAPESQPPGAGGRGRGGGGGNVTASPGSLHIDCSTVQSLIDRAYVFFGEPLLNESGPPREETPRIKGGPAWIRSEKYSIEATAEGAATRETMLGPMLRTFLEERLQLQHHRQVEPIDAYALTVAKSGLKIQPVGEDGCTPYDPANAQPAAATAPAGKPVCGSVNRSMRGSTRIIDLGGMEFEILMVVLKLDRPVIDRTDRGERFNIHLEYVPDEAQADADAPGPNVFRALEQQLGLKLEPIKASHGVIVVDKVVRP